MSLRRPTDPRKHGLKEPNKAHKKIDKVFLVKGEYYSKMKVSLQNISSVWNRILKDFEGTKYRIVDEPSIESDSESIHIIYSYEYDNEDYISQKEDYDQQIAKFEVAMTKYSASAFKEKITLPNLDFKIKRTQERLANLLAAKEGLPLPYIE